MTAGIITERTTIADDAAARMLSQFVRIIPIGGPPPIAEVCGVLEKLIRIIAAEAQKAESVTHDLITERLISTAEGVQLDQWGRRLGCARLGMGDDDYRALLYVWIAVLSSHGTTSELQEIVRRLAGAASVAHRQAGRAHFVLTYDLLTPTTAQRRLLIEQALELAACLGVSWTVTEVDSAGYFGFSEDADALGFDHGILGQVIAQVNA